MKHYITEEKAEEYLKLPKHFDWELIDQEQGFAEVFAFVPAEIFSELKNATEEPYTELFQKLEKTAALYAFVRSIPRIKVHISNFGIEQFTQEKVSAAPWWDVRDLGLSLLKNADRLLSEVLSTLYEDKILKAKIPFFHSTNPYILTPKAFDEIYPIHQSPPVYQMLVPLMERGLSFFISPKIKPCALEDLAADDFISQYLRQAVAFYALYYASMMPTFAFLSNAVVVQYEELPWQKSVVLKDEQKLQTGRNFKQLADESISAILDYIKANPSLFPCYTEPQPSSFPLKKKSGLYL